MKSKRALTFLLVASQFNSSCVHQATAPHAASNNPATPTVLRTPSSEIQNSPWSKWSEKGTIGGLLVLSDIRKNLLKNNLKDPHLNISYMGYTPLKCSEEQVQYRTADGTCNVVDYPHVGAAGVAFGRNIHADYIDKEAQEKLQSPNPDLVSKEFFTRQTYKPVPFLNMLAAVWIQFMNHDWMSHGRNMDAGPYRVRGADGSEIIVDRTKENELDQNIYKKEFGKVSQNTVTHWWDASQVYGSSKSEQNSLRTFSQGKMKTNKVNGQEVLPIDPNFNTGNNKQNQGQEMTGFRDNWWLGLSMLHTLFVKEHNAIAEELIKNHVKKNNNGTYTWKHQWREQVDVPASEKETMYTGGRETKTIIKEHKEVLNEQQLDKKVFEIARMINAAILAKIHTVEWTPAILPNKTLKVGMYTNWYGIINPQTWPLLSKTIGKIPGLNKTDWFENSQSGYLVGGIVGDKTDNYGVPFSITEEFTSVYRLHSLLPEELNLRKLANKNEVSSVPFIETRNEKSYAYMTNYKFEDLFYSFGVQNPGQLVLNNYPQFMQKLTTPGYPDMDLGMIDIVRDRERGVPRYNQFRKAINLIPIKSYRDFFPANIELNENQKEIIKKLERVYGKNADGSDNVEDIDLLVGTLAEEVRPKNFGFGETLFQIFILMASRRLMADRFFTEYYKDQYYTSTGMDWIDNKGTFAQVITRHMPQLKSQVSGIETAFNPWKK